MIGSMHEARSDQDLRLGDIITFLFRRRYYIITASLIGLLIGFYIYVRSPRMYTSTVTVEMNKDASSGLGLQDLSGAGSSIGIGQDFMTDMLTQQAVLMSHNTALSVIDRLNLLSTPPYDAILRTRTGQPPLLPTIAALEQSSDLRDQVLIVFESQLRAAPVKNTRLMTVSFTDPNPERAAAIANAVVEAYLANHTKSRYEATSKASTWLGDQLADLKHQAENIHRQVAQMEKDSGILNLSPNTGSEVSKTSTAGGQPQSSTLEYQQLLMLSQELAQAQLATIQQGTIYRLSQTTKPDALLDQSGTQMALADGTPLATNSPDMQLMSELRTQEAQLKIKLAGEKITYASHNPVIQESQSQLQSVETQMGENMTRIRTEAKKNYDLARAKEASIRAQFDAQKQQVASLGNRMAALAFLEEQEGTSRRLYQDLYTRLEEANIAAGVRSSGMAVVDPARPPSHLSSPGLKKDLAAGLLAGLALGLLLGLVRQFSDITVSTAEEFEKILPYPLLGTVPTFEAQGLVEGSNSGEERGWILRAPKSQVAEAYRQIRTSILLSNVDRPPKVLLFTSATPGEGKSTTSYNLALAFAAQSSKVLLVDADMRRPTLVHHFNFDVQSKSGLSEVLMAGIPFEEAVQAHRHSPSLHILKSGAIPPAPSELLGSKAFATLIERARQDYDYIFIDSPPVLLVTDPVVTSTVADGMVIIVRANKTQKPSLRQLVAALDNPTSRVAGFIVNDFDRRRQGYGYGYGGYENSGYYAQGTEETRS